MTLATNTVTRDDVPSEVEPWRAGWNATGERASATDTGSGPD